MTTEVLIRHNNPSYNSKLKVSILEMGEYADASAIEILPGEEKQCWVHSNQSLVIKEYFDET